MITWHKNRHKYDPTIFYSVHLYPFSFHHLTVQHSLLSLICKHSLLSLFPVTLSSAPPNRPHHHHAHQLPPFELSRRWVEEICYGGERTQWHTITPLNFDRNYKITPDVIFVSIFLCSVIISHFILVFSVIYTHVHNICVCVSVWERREGRGKLSLSHNLLSRDFWVLSYRPTPHLKFF